MKKLLTMMVACLVLTAISVRPVAASANAEKQARFAVKVKSGIEKVGSGRDTHVEIKLRDKTRVKGFVSEIGDNNFVVTDAKTGASNKVAYVDVAQIKGNNMSTGARIAIGVSVAVGLILLISWLVIASSD